MVRLILGHPVSFGEPFR